MKSSLAAIVLLACVQAQHYFEPEYPDRHVHEVKNQLMGLMLIPVEEPGVPYPVYELRPYTKAPEKEPMPTPTPSPRLPPKPMPTQMPTPTYKP